MGLGAGRSGVRRSAKEAVILLDTNALLWLERGHRRARPLEKAGRALYVSPISMLELQLLSEAGRFRLGHAAVTSLFADDRWLVDDPPAGRWFEASLSVSWTRDVFARLRVADARYRGWRLATSDQAILQHLSDSERLEL